MELLFAFPLEVYDTNSFLNAQVCSGGVPLSEINPKTMESKIVPGLYFAGEIIDVDSYTGGFNLQIAYSTGYTAGKLYIKRQLGQVKFVSPNCRKKLSLFCSLIKKGEI